MNTATKTEEHVAVTLRLPKSLIAAVASEAAETLRSKTNVIKIALQFYFAARAKQQTPKK